MNVKSSSGIKVTYFYNVGLAALGQFELKVQETNKDVFDDSEQ